jgi:CTP synthase
VCGLKDADSTEFDPDTPFPVIFKLRDLVDVDELGGTMRLGVYPCELAEGSLARDIYQGAENISERHRHRYEFNPEFRETLETAGLGFSGVSPDGKFVEIVELPRDVHPWFVGCQFHPEYRSKPLTPHPLFASFVNAAFSCRMQSEAIMDERADAELVPRERTATAGDD